MDITPNSHLSNKNIIDDNIKFNYIIFHRNCLDGFTGFYLFMKTKKWEKKPIVFPDVPSAKYPPPNIDKKNIIIIDVAYNSEIIKYISQKASKLLFIDHHTSIRKDILNLKLPENNEIVYDINQSGASLVWKYFFGTQKMPTFVEYIRDNDIGAWKLDNTLPFIAGLEVNFELEPTYNNLIEWDKLLDEEFLNSLIERGKVYNEYKEYLIKRYSKKYTLMHFPSKKILNKLKLNLKEGQYKVAVVNSSCPSVSLLGKYIVDTVDCDFCILWNYSINKKIFIIALRSKNVDISEIAKKFGGGGHKYAAGFSFHISKFSINDLFVK